MKFSASLLVSCLAFFSTMTSVNAAYKYENGMKFYIEGSQDKSKNTRQPSYKRAQPSKSRSENPLERLVKHTFVHLVPVWGGTKCGSRWTEVIVPDAFTSPMGGVDFSQSCAIHDQCYTKQKGRGFCDRQIHNNLKIQCRRAFPQKNNHLRAECLSYTNLYFHTISQFGTIGYNAVQTTQRQVRRSYRSVKRNTHSAAQWITGRKRRHLKR